MCFFPSLMLVRNFHREREKNKKKTVFLSQDTQDNRWLNFAKNLRIDLLFLHNFFILTRHSGFTLFKDRFKVFYHILHWTNPVNRVFCDAKASTEYMFQNSSFRSPPIQVIEAWSKNVRIIKTKTIYNCWSCFKHSKRKTSM